MGNDLDMKRREQRARWLDWFERPDLTAGIGAWWPLFREEDRLRIEQEVTDDSVVIRAELPGIDPDKDVEITVDDGVLTIRAERRSEKTEEQLGCTRSEFRYGSFARALRVPKDMNPDEVTATYKDGILEVKAPYKVPTAAQPRKVAINKL